MGSQLWEGEERGTGQRDPVAAPTGRACAGGVLSGTELADL